MNNTDRIAKIRARADAATAGPWHGPHDSEIGLCVRFGDYGWTAGSPDGNGPEYDVDSEQGKADAEFIAHARTDIEVLLDENASLAADLRMERLLRRRAEERHHAADVDNQAMARQRDQIREVLDWRPTTGTVPSGALLARRALADEITEILDREAT